jgi:DAK2 domain fusion protein YloV
MTFKLANNSQTKIPAIANDPCTGLGLKNILQAGQHWLELHVHQVDRLNVFPVPDGDTGTNMLLTMRAALKEVEQAADWRVDTVAATAARGALMGARGNSGVILSQFLAGLAAGLKDRADFTAKEFAHALKLGVDQAYQSLLNPVEGTILTVLRAISEAAGQNIKLNHTLAILFSDLVQAGKIAQSKTPELLPVLKEAGVTDAGGQGLLYILEGGLRFIQCKPFDLEPTEAIMSPRLTIAAAAKTYGYDVQFLIYGQQLNLAEIRADINAMGQSALVVGDQQLVKVHVHVVNPELPLRYGLRLGFVTDLLIEDMGPQVKAFVNQSLTSPAQFSVAWAGLNGQTATKAIEIISIVPGTGFADIFKSLGAGAVVLRDKFVPGDLQSWLNLVNRIEAEQLLILPDDNQMLAMIWQVQKLSHKHVQVAPTHTTPQAIAAMLAFNHQSPLGDNVRRMAHAAQQVHTVELSPAPQLATINGKAGAEVVAAFFEGELVNAGPDCSGVLHGTLTQLDTASYELVTIYFGQDIVQAQAEKLANQVKDTYPELEVELYYGGQPHSHYLISLE